MSSSVYECKLRVRASGILIEDEQMLFVQLNSPISKNLIWLPPGGGVQFGESIKSTVQREFLEETGLSVSVHNLLLINELIEPPFHALEFFFNVKRVSGKLKLGKDPEHVIESQILKDVRFINKIEFPDFNISSHFLKDVFWTNNKKVVERVYTSFQG